MAILRIGEDIAIAEDALVELMISYKGPDDITRPEGLLKQLSKSLIERAMQVSKILGEVQILRIHAIRP